jgi:hypothetical protein
MMNQQTSLATRSCNGQKLETCTPTREECKAEVSAPFFCDYSVMGNAPKVISLLFSYLILFKT